MYLIIPGCYALKSEQEKLIAEIKLNEQRQDSHNLLVELFSKEPRRRPEKGGKPRKNVEKLAGRSSENAASRRPLRPGRTPRDAIVEVPLLPKIVQDQFAINIELSTELEEVTREETVLAGKHAGYQSRS